MTTSRGADAEPSHQNAKHGDVKIPKRSKWLLDGFLWYCRRIIRHDFHAFALHDQALCEAAWPKDSPLVVYCNHPGWWDPILAILTHQIAFPDYGFFAPIEGEALKKYQVLSKLGFYGVTLESFRGAADFLTTSRAILAGDRNAIYLTPEGRFCDVRDQQNRFKPGLAHLFTTIPNLVAIPMAIEYAFWNERKPLMFARFGTPILQSKSSVIKSDVCNFLESGLRTVQNQLAELVLQRSLDPFRVIVSPKKGPTSAYDAARFGKSLLTGRSIELRHDA